MKVCDIPLCFESCAYGEGCPIDKCKCSGHTERGGWISVKDEWPEDGVDVLMFTPGIGVEPGYQQAGKTFYALAIEDRVRVTPTHWMPYPAPPEAE